MVSDNKRPGNCLGWSEFLTQSPTSDFGLTMDFLAKQSGFPRSQLQFSPLLTSHGALTVVVVALCLQFSSFVYFFKKILETAI